MAPLRTRKVNVSRRRGATSASSQKCSLSLMIVYGIVVSMLLYVIAVVSLTSSLQSLNKKNSDNSQSNIVVDNPAPVALPDPVQNGGKQQHFPVERDWGHGVEPQLLRTGKDNKPAENTAKPLIQPPKRDGPVLAAYLEPIDRSSWDIKPLPPRKFTSEDLTKVEYPRMTTCSKLPEQWPVDEFPDEDPFLPWIHDVFPSYDGKYIQFIAQNKRRCHTGTTKDEIRILHETEPQITLFQHVPVKRLESGGDDAETRYRLSTHDEADVDGVETRFICKFKPTGEETLSDYNFNYEWASFRKRIHEVFHQDGRDNKQVHTSQLIFRCPVPESLVEDVRTGKTVINDAATMFLDLIPIRTPPRYGSPTAFLPPYYEEFRAKGNASFNATLEWGQSHILPRIQDSGRWENIPICKPSHLTYPEPNSKALVSTSDAEDQPPKKHHVVSCLWASTGYATRGNRFAINDGQRRLLEFISYHKLIGVDHFYLYDNSAAFSNDPENSLHSIAALFPDDVTVIDWPSKVCNNNKNNVDSPGERSSQYAAEASCRLRFGPHTNWIAQLDLDEYVVPMGNATTILPLLDKLDAEGNKIVSFGSWRAWPRRRFIETPVRQHGNEICGRDQDCFQLRIPLNYTILQSYNCDRQKPGQKTEQMPAEKQIYRPDYVFHHFIHYSTVTGRSILNRRDTLKLGVQWKSGSAFPDPLSRFGDEVTEGLMLHTKAVATQDTVFWEKACSASYDGQMSCRLGSPFPENMVGVNISEGDQGWKFNCYVNHKIDDYFVPLLEQRMKSHVPELSDRMDSGLKAGGY
eukprot:Nitzschia sp. Nitz4//scaffold88_size82704//53664//56296//NITZ4_005298-RA/size82704-augustus-gene-0.83-mRNA-1//-1//CDS//3329559512//7316//frame0